MGGLIDGHEVNFARSLTRRYRLHPPVDVAALVQQYARLEFKRIPFTSVDGVSLNLKVSGRKPKVIVNSANSHARQRFTLAHELGHIIIPWHTGTIIDELDPSVSFGEWYEREQEANAFAAELLIPSEWLENLIATERDLGRLHAYVITTCDISAQAAAINLIKRLPRNIICAAERNGVVEFSGHTEGSTAHRPAWGEELPPNPYQYVEDYYSFTSQSRRIHWWRIPTEVTLAANDRRSWREILDQVVAESGVPPGQRHTVKQSITAVISAANSQAKKVGPHTVAGIVSFAVHMFQRSESNAIRRYPRLLEHPKFEAFLVKRAQDFKLGSVGRADR